MNRKSYPSDLTDAQWEKLSSFLPTPHPLGRPLKWEMRLNHQRHLLCRQVRLPMANATP